MKKHILFSLALVAILATGCPVGLDHPLDAPNANKIDKDLLGTWNNASEGAEVVKVSITEASPFWPSRAKEVRLCEPTRAQLLPSCISIR